MQLTLNKASKKTLERRFGISVVDLSKMDIEALDRVVEKKIQKKLTYQTRYKSLISRGSIYLFLNRLLSLKEVDKGLSQI